MGTDKKVCQIKAFTPQSLKSHKHTCQEFKYLTSLYWKCSQGNIVGKTNKCFSFHNHLYQNTFISLSRARDVPHYLSAASAPHHCLSPGPPLTPAPPPPEAASRSDHLTQAAHYLACQCPDKPASRSVRCCHQRLCVSKEGPVYNRETTWYKQYAFGKP